MYRSLSFYGLLFLLSACSNNTQLEADLATAQSELAQAQAKITNLEQQIEPEGDLIHLVFFRLQADTYPTDLITAIKKLEDIPEVMDLEVGPYEELGDARALKEFSLLMSMSFADSSAYQRYQAHPIHLALKENAKAYLAGPPATYDFVRE